jgi:eukaryotic-like serine/threonine-protein kinase
LHLNDFGTAKSSIIDEDRINTSHDTKTGTTAYMAPEILNATPDDPTPDITKQDVWAVGIIAYQICTFNLPFRGGTGALINAIINTPHKPIAHQGYSADLKGLIDQILTKDPTKRPSI